MKVYHQKRRKTQSINYKLLGDIFTSKKSYKNPIDHASNELVRYEAEETLDLDGNPLKWWKERDKLYPILSDLSCKFFHYQTLVFHLREFSAGLVM